MSPGNEVSDVWDDRVPRQTHSSIKKPCSSGLVHYVYVLCVVIVELASIYFPLGWLVKFSAGAVRWLCPTLTITRPQTLFQSSGLFVWALWCFGSKLSLFNVFESWWAPAFMMRCSPLISWLTLSPVLQQTKCSSFYSHPHFCGVSTLKVHSASGYRSSNLWNQTWALFLCVICALVRPSLFSCSCCLLQSHISYYCFNSAAVDYCSSHLLSINESKQLGESGNTVSARHYFMDTLEEKWKI